MREKHEPTEERIAPQSPKDIPDEAKPRIVSSKKRVAVVAAVILIVALAATAFCTHGFGFIEQSTNINDATIESQHGEDAGSSDKDATSEDEKSGENEAVSSSGLEQASAEGQGSSAGSGSGSSSSGSGGGEQPVQTIRVSVYVDGSVAGYGCMASGTYTLAVGSTPYDALCATGLGIGGSRSYVTSINGLAEKALGGKSGWMYSVNGLTPMDAADSYPLADGDSVNWHFVDSW